MKASEVIAALRKLVEQHGDLPVKVHDGLEPSDLVSASEVRAVGSATRKSFFTIES